MNRRGRVPDSLRPAQDFLNGARHAKMELDALREMRARLREHVSMRCRPDRWAIPERKTKQEYMDDLARTEKAMFEVEETLEKRCRAVFAMIASVPDETVRTVLELRYIACKPIFVIARKTNYCDRQVYRLQTIGLLWVKEQLEKQERAALETETGPQPAAR